MQVERLNVGALETNCYIISSEKQSAAVIDPGDDANRILGEIGGRGLSVLYVIDTHAHADHTGANGPVLEATGARLVVGKEDVSMLKDPAANLSAFIGKEAISPSPAVVVEDGDRIEVDEIELRFIHTPGHTPGSMCVASDEILFSGDTLFAGSVGRTDLAGGSSRRLAESLRKLEEFPDETIVYPGHGEPTTMGRERRLNPFLQGEIE